MNFCESKFSPHLWIYLNTDCEFPKWAGTLCRKVFPLRVLNKFDKGPFYGEGIKMVIKEARKNSRLIVIIAGPTATFKSDVTIELALFLKKKRMGFGVVNFDSLSFYKELKIGTARPSFEKRRGVEHELMEMISLESPLDASSFCHLAREHIKNLHKKGHIPLLVGGSAFYIRALVKGMYENSFDGDIKKTLQEIYEKKGILPFYKYLKIHDPTVLGHIHLHDHYRLMRAVEYHKMKGVPISCEKKKFEDQGPYDFSRPLDPSWKVLTFYFDIPKERHWEIIKKRTKKMIESGLIDEVRSLLSQGFTGHERPLRATGYKETQEYIKGNIATKEELEEKINISTRQLAKSQRTFFKKIGPKIPFNPLEDKQEILTDAILNHFTRSQKSLL